MLITCPSCAAEYNVPAPVAPGRVVRCARCATEWAPTALPVAAAPTAVQAPVTQVRVMDAPVIDAPVMDAPAVDAPVSDAPVPAAAPEPARSGIGRPVPVSVAAARPGKLAAPAGRRTPGRAPLLLAWGGSVVLLALVAAAGVVWRGPVMQAWPPSMRVYQALGLTAHP